MTRLTKLNVAGNIMLEGADLYVSWQQLVSNKGI